MAFFFTFIFCHISIRFTSELHRMDIKYGSFSDSNFVENTGLTYCIITIYQSKFKNILCTIYKLKLVLKKPKSEGRYKSICQTQLITIDLYRFNPDYALEMHKRLTSCKSICIAKLITTAIPKFLREG